MKPIKKIFCVLTVFLLISAALLPALAAASNDAPSGYDAHDYEKLRSFFELQSLQGCPNGIIMNSGYDPDDPETWKGLEWTDDAVRKLKSFSICKYGLTGVLDLSGCSGLEVLDCSYSSMEGVDVTGCGNLKVLLCSMNKELKQLSIGGCSALQTLNCEGTALGSLDLSALKNLKTVSCCDSELTALTLGSLTKLETLDCSWNSLASLDTSGCSKLTELNCDANKLTSLNVKSNKSLKTLFCSDNALTSLTVYKSSTLASLVCMNNKLAEIDLVGCGFNIKKLSVSGKGYVGCDLARTYESANVVYAYAPAGSAFVKWVDTNGVHLYSQPAVPYSYQEAYMTAVFEASAIPGDVDGSGSLDASDALVILRCVLGIEELSDELASVCDADGNGVVNTLDALMVLRAALGIVE